MFFHLLPLTLVSIRVVTLVEGPSYVLVLKQFLERGKRGRRGKHLNSARRGMHNLETLHP